jgi:hypothetical protein
MGTGRRPGLLDAEAANLDQVPAGRRRDAVHAAATRTVSSGGMFRIMATGNAENMAHIGYAAMTDQAGPVTLSRSPAHTNSSAGLSAVGPSTPELPSLSGFDGAAQYVTPEGTAEAIPRGDDVDTAARPG